MKKAKISKKIREGIINELWENAVFDNEILKTVNIITKKQAESNRDADYIFSEPSCFTLSTSRNRNLITFAQQKKLKGVVVGFFGLSVGSHAALTWMMQSRADTIKIVDPDMISPTNLNRIRVGWKDVGKLKVKVIERQLYEINPFTKVITSVRKNARLTLDYFQKKPLLNCIVDSMDDMAGKILIREFAKKARIPVIMATDIGDNVMLDVERYDLDPQPELFLGFAPKIKSIDFKKLSDLERRRLVIRIVGFEKNSEAMLSSLNELGEKLLTWPQLGATATIAGGVITTTIKKIFLGENIPNGRYFFSLDEILITDFNTLERKKIRKDLVEKVKRKFRIQRNSYGK